MESKLFSYRADGIVLQPFDDRLKLSKTFDKKELLTQLKETLKKQDFSIDEHTLNYKIVDDQLYIEGMALAYQEPKTIGFMTGKR